MDKKFKIIIIIVIIAVIGIIASLSLGLFSTGPTTKFNNNFMSGSIVGNATLQPPETTSEYDKWAQSYNDKINVEILDKRIFINVLKTIRYVISKYNFIL